MCSVVFFGLALTFTTHVLVHTMHGTRKTNLPLGMRRARSHSLIRQKRPSSSIPYKTIIGIAAGSLVVAGIFFVILKLFSLYNTIHIDAGSNSTGKVKVEKKTAYNILLTGYGGGVHEGTYLTDTVMIAHVDTVKNKVVLFSIPRDLWVKVPGKTEDDAFYTKINAVYQAGLFPESYPNIPKEYQGEENAPGLLKKVVKDVTGLEIDYFVGVDFEGFSKFIDTIGGVDVIVQKSFDDYFYPVDGKEADTCGREPKPTSTEDQLKEEREKYEKMSDEEKKAFDERPIDQLSELEFQKIATEEPHLAYPCRYEHLHFDKGPTKMDGATALKFARSRKSLEDGGDFNRAARQQLVVEAIKSKVLSIGFLPKILPTLDTLSEHIRTDMPISQIQEFLKEAPAANSYKISSYVLNQGEELVDDMSDDGQYILAPAEGIGNYSGIYKVVKNVILEITPTVTPVASEEATLKDSSDSADNE